MDNEKKEEKREDISEVIRKKLEVYKKRQSNEHYDKKIKPLQDSTKKTFENYHSNENHPVFFTRKFIKKPRKKSFDVVIILFLLIVIFTFGYIFYAAFLKSTERELDAGFGRAVIDNEKTASLIIDDSVNLEGIREVSVVFSDGKSDYFYNPTDISSSYEISSNDLNIENFKKINSISIFFEYKQEINETSSVLLSTKSNTYSQDKSLESVSSLSPFAGFWKWVRGFR